MGDWLKPVVWPNGKRFAFTIFDDPDGQSLEVSRIVYRFLADLGFRTTIAVWPLAARRQPNSGGETCANPQYLEHVRKLAANGFEVAWHNATLHTSTREETAEGFDRFRGYFGHDPMSMANHYNGEALYWGPERLTGIRRSLYNLLTRFRAASRHFGHVEGHPYFWGDICRNRIRYCRNFIFSDFNTLRMCPWMPYHDPQRPWVNRWFAGSEGAQVSCVPEDHQRGQSGPFRGRRRGIHHVHALRPWLRIRRRTGSNLRTPHAAPEQEERLVRTYTCTPGSSGSRAGRLRAERRRTPQAGVALAG